MTERYHVRHVGKRFAIVEIATGRVLSEWSAHAYALSAIDHMERKARQKVRPCMTCGKAFRSDGPGNRMCDRCRLINSESMDTLGIAP